MFNYNVVNPVNIHYRKYSKNGDTEKSSENNSFQKAITTDEDGSQRRFPNGNKVAIDYTKNNINISQVLQDFRSTISAINSPQDVADEVESYLGLVGKESMKDEPSRDIVISNLKNAARVTDKYIQDSLKKPSRVVQDWVDALFLQNVNLKANPNEVNEDFRVKIPKKGTVSGAAANIAPKTVHTEGLSPLDKDTVSFSKNDTEFASGENEKIEYTAEKSFIEGSYTSSVPAEFENTAPAEFKSRTAIEPEQNTGAEFKSRTAEELQDYTTHAPSYYAAATQNEALAKEALLRGISSFENGEDMYSTLKLYDEALELTQGSENRNLKSAIYYERAKIFDSYDYPELALIDYNKATKTDDGNLKTHAHIKMGNIYDDYVQIEPAMDQYSKAIETAQEVENSQGKTRALRYMASMFAGIYDKENTQTFTDLAIESAKETQSGRTIAKTYLEAADNYKYIGEDSKALQMYSSLAQEETVQEDYDSLAQNYMEASALMDKKGNKKKSYALMLKSKEYQRLARLRRMS